MWKGVFLYLCNRNARSLPQPARKAVSVIPQQQSTSRSVFSFFPTSFTIDCSEADFLLRDSITLYVSAEKYCTEVLLFLMLTAVLMSLSCTVHSLKTKPHEKGFSVKENPANDICLFNPVNFHGSSAFERAAYLYLPLCLLYANINNPVAHECSFIRVDTVQGNRSVPAPVWSCGQVPAGRYRMCRQTHHNPGRLLQRLPLNVHRHRQYSQS